MREGAFALIDCLGFKGIWKRADSSALLHKLEGIVSSIENQITLKVQAYEHLKEPIKVNATLLSDSVAISLQYENCFSGSEGYKSYLMWLLCSSTIKVLDLYLEGEPHLVLRGCVTYGQYESRGNFIVGPAVDDAAENVELSQGAFVWLLPVAATLYRSCRDSLTSFLRTSTMGEWVKRTMLTEEATESEVIKLSNDIEAFMSEPVVIDPYEMPLKTGDRLRCPVLNPLAYHPTRRSRRTAMQAYSKAMSGNQLDVLLKHQYTMEFLSVADEVCAETRPRAETA
jgi:hypothetical protein